MLYVLEGAVTLLAYDTTQLAVVVACAPWEAAVDGVFAPVLTQQKLRLEDSAAAVLQEPI